MKTSTAAITTVCGTSQSKPPFNKKPFLRRNASQAAARGLVQWALSEACVMWTLPLDWQDIKRAFAQRVAGSDHGNS
jgi:hypothetical protein